MPQLDTGQVALYYEVQGSGPPLLLVCGTALGITGWMLQLPWLAERRTVIAFDNRDCGRSGYVETDYAPADVARDAAALLRHLELGPVDVLGYSLGGAVAQELALAEPALVSKLILLSTWDATDGWFRQKMRTWHLAGERMSDEELLDVLLFDLFTHRWFADEAQVESFRALAMANPWPQRRDGFLRQVRANQRHDARDRLTGIVQPTLVVCGTEDQVTPDRYSRALASAIPDAKLRLVEGAGHGLLFERPDELRHVVGPAFGA